MVEIIMLVAIPLRGLTIVIFQGYVENLHVEYPRCS
jgi:hypothetical protein